METNNKPNSIDRILDKLILWVIPRFLRPNHFTFVRILSVPFVVWVLWNGDYLLGVVLFAIFAFTDAIDGALARTRDQITDWGRIFDPIADKLLISFSALVVIYKFDPVAAIAIVSLDLAIGAAAIYHLRTRKQIVNPHITGKIKMILQSLGVIAVLVFFITDIESVEFIARALIYFALGMGLISVAVYKSA